MSTLSRRTLLIGALAAPLVRAAPDTSNVTVAGIEFPRTLQVQRQNLLLNGAGVRYKAVFKVYAAALYLPKPASTTRDVLSMEGPKRIVVSMLREIDSAELGKLFARGMEENMDKAAFSPMATQIPPPMATSNSPT